MAIQIDKYGVGIDISMKDFHVCLMTLHADGSPKIKATRKFKQNNQGFEAFYEWLRKHCKNLDQIYQLVMEVTGVYHENLLFFLHEKGLPVCLVLAKQAKDYRKSINFHSKNDKLDGQALAHMSLHRKLRLWKPVTENIYHIRALLRHRKALLETRTIFMNRLHALKHGHRSLEYLTKATRDTIDALETQIEEAEQQAIDMAKKDADFWARVERISKSFPGLGLLSVLCITSETNGFNDFFSIRQLIKYAGYDVIENQSGKVTGNTRISKRGNARIRAALYMPALTVIRCKIEPFFSLYQRLIKRNGGIKKKAQVAVQRKLLCYIYTLWKKQEAFDPDFLKNQQSALHTKNPENGGSPDFEPGLHGIELHKEVLPFPS